jgi:hypothetical protein
VRSPGPDADVLVLDRPGPEVGLVDQVAQAERHEALLPASDADELGAASLDGEKRFETELEIRVVPGGDVLGDDGNLARLYSQVPAQERPEGRLLAANSWPNSSVSIS